MNNQLQEEIKQKFNAEILRFKSDRICLLKNFLTSSKVKELQSESENLWQQQKLTANNIRFGLRDNSSGELVFDRLDPVEDISPAFAQLNNDPFLLALVELLLEEKSLVMKEKLIYKRSGTKGFGLHRDEPYFNSSGATGVEMLSFLIALDKHNEANGAMKFYPTLRTTPLKAPSNESRDIMQEEVSDVSAYMPELKAGDAVIFDGLIPHCSDINQSTHSRRTYMITFIPDRYHDGRSKYYRYRMLEQSQERAPKHSGEFFLK